MLDLEQMSLSIFDELFFILFNLPKLKNKVVLRCTLMERLFKDKGKFNLSYLSIFLYFSHFPSNQLGQKVSSRVKTCMYVHSENKISSIFCFINMGDFDTYTRVIGMLVRKHMFHEISKLKSVFDTFLGKRKRLSSVFVSCAQEAHRTLILEEEF